MSTCNVTVRMTRGRSPRRAAALTAGLVSLLTAFGASASQDFPSEVQKTLDMPCPPPCTLCHTTQLGGSGTAVKQFAIVLRNTGIMATPPVLVQAGDAAGVGAALKIAEATGMDSDGDMVPDTEELKDGRDPNTPGGDARICGPSYGCGARLAAPPASQTGALIVAGGVAALVAFGLRRRR